MPVSRFFRAAGTQSEPLPTPSAALSLDEVKHALRIDGSEDYDTDVQIERAIAAATAMADRQAPGAPDAIKSEAIIRCVGWLFDGRQSDSVTLTGIWTRSGARSLLAPWTVRRGGLVQAAD